jgi:phage FluMu protein Com
VVAVTEVAVVRIRCQACQKMLRIADAHRGKTAKCPNCAQRFVVPEADEDEANEDVVGTYTTREERSAPTPPPPVLRPRVRYVDDDEDDDRPRRRRRRRRRGGGGSFFADWGVGKVLLTVAAGVWLMLIGLSFLQPAFAVILIGLGFLMVIAARIWMVVAAFSEDAGLGCLAIALPWYGLWAVEDRRPLILLAVGILFILSAVVVMVALHGLGVM